MKYWNLLTLLVISISLPIRTLAISLPDPDLTPGSTLTVPLRVLCKPGYTSKVRHVTEAMKKRILERYKAKYPDWPSGPYEYDHVESLELGGSNSELNLFPQPLLEAKSKDSIENKLHREVCSGKISLKDAQKRIKEWWKE